MESFTNSKVLFIAGFGPIVRDGNATAELEERGYPMLIKNKKEPWGQTVSRLISPEGLLVGITFTPSMREDR